MQVPGCRLGLQVAGQNLEKELNVLNGLQIQSRGPKTEHYKDVLVISYSRQGHAKPEISDLSSINRFFSPRSFFSRRKVLLLAKLA